MAPSPPAKALYEIVHGFMHKGVYAHTGFKIALTDGEAKYHLLSGNVRAIPANDAAPSDPVDPTPAAAVPVPAEAAAPVAAKKRA